MAKKDPAFLFYPSDFLTGTVFLSKEEIGIYILLLCYQHQHGGMIDKESFYSLVGENKLIRKKFIETSEGFFNERLMLEMEKRNKKSNNIREAVKEVWEKRKSDAIVMESHNNPKENGCDYNGIPMGIINRNKDIIINKKVKEEKVEIRENVFLTLKEIEKLKLDFGEGYEWAIDTISNYKFSSGKKYKSDYHALIGWVKDKYVTEKNKTKHGNTTLSEQAKRRNELERFSASFDQMLKASEDTNSGTDSI